MNSINRENPLQAGANPTTAAERAASLGDLATETSDYVRAWSSLFASETRLAGISVMRLVFAALVLPAVALCICIVVDALLATLLQRWLGDWASSAALVLCLDLVALVGLVAAMRSWWRNLSLPRSREALSHLLERLA